MASFVFAIFLNTPLISPFGVLRGIERQEKPKKNLAKAVYFVVSLTNEHDLNDFEMS